MVVLFGSKKGGSWKSTTCVNLAAAAANSGMSVCIVDADTNETANSYIRRRNETSVNLESSGGQSLSFIKCEIKRPEDTINKDLQILDKQYDLVIVDTGGYENNAFKTGIQVADIVYVPFQPCQVEMEQLTATIKVIHETETFIKALVGGYSIDTRLLIVGVDQNSQDLFVEAKEISKSLLPWCSISSAVLRTVKAVRKLQEYGTTISDTKHPKRAMYELLLDEILGKRTVAINREVSNG